MSSKRNYRQTTIALRFGSECFEFRSALAAVLRYATSVALKSTTTVPGNKYVIISTVCSVRACLNRQNELCERVAGNETFPPKGPPHRPPEFLDRRFGVNLRYPSGRKRLKREKKSIRRPAASRLTYTRRLILQSFKHEYGEIFKTKFVRTRVKLKKKKYEERCKIRKK